MALSYVIAYFAQLQKYAKLPLVIYIIFQCCFSKFEVVDRFLFLQEQVVPYLLPRLTDDLIIFVILLLLCNIKYDKPNSISISLAAQVSWEILLLSKLRTEAKNGCDTQGCL